MAVDARDRVLGEAPGGAERVAENPAPPGGPHSLALRLSTEELRAALWLLGIPLLPGFDDDEVDGLSEEALGLLLRAGHRGLRARGLAGAGRDADRALDESLAGILALCGSPSVTVAVRREGGASGETVRVYHTAGGVAAEHEYDGEGVHALGAMDAADVAERVALLAFLSLPPDGEPAVAGESAAGNGPEPEEQVQVLVSTETMNHARAQAVSGGDGLAGAVRTLEGAGVSPLASRMLAEDLARLEAVTTIGVIRGDDPRDIADGGVVLGCGGTTWLLQGEEDRTACTRLAYPSLVARIGAMIGAVDG